MSKVVIKSTNLKQITSKKTGVLYFFQTAGLDDGTDFAQPFEILHNDPKNVYAPGDYTFADDAIYVKDGKLQVSGRLKPLIPAARSVPAAAKPV
jgi:hypothetical protein